MDMSAVRSAALDAQFDLLPGSVTASTVQPKGKPSLTNVKALSLGSVTEDAPDGMDLSRREARRMFAFKHADVPSLPEGSTFVAPEAPGGTSKTWRVDGPDYRDAEHRRVVVVEVT